MYLIGKHNFNFDVIIYAPLKKNSFNKRNEGSASIDALEYQCKTLNIPLIKIKSFNSAKMIKKIKEHNIDAALALIADTILSEKILNYFKKGVYLTHGGMLPNYRGVDANKWALAKGKKVSGITLLKLSKGVDTGEIVFSKKIRNQNKTLNEIDKELIYLLL